MKYMNFNPKVHDANKIATLRYNVDFRTYDKLFGSKEKAIETLEKTLKKDEYTKVIYDNENIIGILVAYTQDNEPKFHFQSFKLLIHEILDYFEEQAEKNYGLVPYDVIEDYITLIG